ncbi:NUDIX hydrolase [Loktanella agnita]|uniref:NUDIX hydrolase n=1 Tax=Loktanella agnita TaxID=287097 RepID=UPI0039866D58
MSYPKLAAIAVVIHQGRVLLVQRKNEPDAGLWGFPGGHVNWGESALDAAARELAEETGVRARPEKYLTNLDIIIHEDGALKYHFLLAVVLCTYQSGTPQADDDVQDATWVDLDQVAHLPTSADVAEIAARAAAD